MSGNTQYKSRVYTDRPAYADFDAPRKFQAIEGIIARRLKEHPNAICSYSGGADSDILIDLIERTRAIFRLPPVKYCFFNTGLEMKATRDHVRATAERYGVEIEERRPKVNIVTATRKYGVPFVSKIMSAGLSEWQKKGIPLSIAEEYEQAEDKAAKRKELKARYPNCESVINFLCCCNAAGEPRPNIQLVINSSKYMRDFIAESPPDFKISAKCCDYCKKQTAHEAQKGYDMVITGERRDEGGMRSVPRKDNTALCFTETSGGQYRLRPLYYVSDGDKAWYKEEYGIRYSDAYEVYGLTRTGCCGCPISYKAADDLELIRPYEPNLVKAAWNVFGASYRYRAEYNAYKAKRAADEKNAERGVTMKTIEKNALMERMTAGDGGELSRAVLKKTTGTLADALRNVPDSDTGGGDTGGREQIEYIDLTALDADADNFYSLDGVDELAANIELIGLQQPLRVRPNPDMPGRYFIVSGHRRRAALMMLAEEGQERFLKVPCIVEQPAGSAALQELRLIYANSDTRRMSSADLSKQAERVEALLYQLKEEGFEFPGRMRNHVAEACRVSKTKLATLKVIREGLIPEMKTLWAQNLLNESKALTMARESEDIQRKFWKQYGSIPLRIGTEQELAHSIVLLKNNENVPGVQPTQMVRARRDGYRPLASGSLPEKGQRVILAGRMDGETVYSERVWTGTELNAYEKNVYTLWTPTPLATFAVSSPAEEQDDGRETA